jgi:hypothetical protein
MPSLSLGRSDERPLRHQGGGRNHILTFRPHPHSYPMTTVAILPAQCFVGDDGPDGEVRTYSQPVRTRGGCPNRDSVLLRV